MTNYNHHSTIHKLTSIFLVVIVLMTTLVLSSCKKQRIYKFEYVDDATYKVMISEDDVGYTLDKIEAIIECIGDDFELVNDGQGNMTFKRVPNKEYDKQVSLYEIYDLPSRYVMNPEESLLEYDMRAGALAINDYLAKNGYENYEFCKLSVDYIHPILDKNQLIIFYDAVNKDNGKVVIGNILVDVKPINYHQLEFLSILAKNCSKAQYPKVLEGIFILASESTHVEMSPELDREIVTNANYKYNFYIKQTRPNVGINYPLSAAGSIVYIYGKYYLYHGYRPYVTLTEIDFSPNTADADEIGLIFKDSEGKPTYLEYRVNFFSHLELEEIDLLHF